MYITLKEVRNGQLQDSQEELCDLDSPVDCSAGNKRTPPVTAGITELDVPSKKSCYQMLNPMDHEIQNKQLGKRTAGRAC